MADISKIKVNGTVYNIKDAQARQSAGVWGQITGTMSNQTDLQTALNSKANIADLGGIQVRPDYIISSTDLVDGTSSLASGVLYFYYEV